MSGEGLSCWTVWHLLNFMEIKGSSPNLWNIWKLEGTGRILWQIVPWVFGIRCDDHWNTHAVELHAQVHSRWGPHCLQIPEINTVLSFNHKHELITWSELELCIEMDKDRNWWQQALNLESMTMAHLFLLGTKNFIWHPRADLENVSQAVKQGEWMMLWKLLSSQPY